MKKKHILILLSTIFVSISFSPYKLYPINIKGNGNLVTSEINIPKFEKINSGGSAEVYFHLSPEYRVVITADSNIIEYIEIITRGKTLHIGNKKGYSLSFTKMLVNIYSPVLTSVSISGSGTFISDDVINARRFEINVSGSGRIEGKIDSNNFFATISGNGRINIIGSSDSSNINISGSGRINSLDFCTNNATVRVTGSGNADIYVLNNLVVNISGIGRINYRGNPRIESKIRGSGRINKI